MNKKILIVEDDADVMEGYHIRLTANHYATFLAADAPGAMTQAQAHRPDLIILDLGLPGGDGFKVMENLKAIPHLAVIPVIVISGRDPSLNRDRALQAGAKAFMRKPVDNDKLLDLIRKYLPEPAREPAAAKDW